MTNLLTKHGLTGNSGLGALGCFHVSANYAARKAGCFVEVIPRGERVPTWRRMTVERATKEKRHIISCSYCRRPAISLDHYWPYHSEANHCAWHTNWTELAELAAEAQP